MAAAANPFRLQNFVINFEQTWSDGSTTSGCYTVEAVHEEGAEIIFTWRNSVPPAGVVQQRILSVCAQ
jgi:hypothetical protein